MSTSHTDDHIDRLGEMFELQGDLQRNTYGSHPADIEDPVERIQFFKDMHIAITDEMHEALNEIGWKPWATSKHFNEDAVKGELVDAFHFFMNLCMAAGMTPDELYNRYKAKRLKNIQRQKDGYDGVATKCKMCGKAYDDLAVKCHRSSVDSPDGWCGGPTNVADLNWDYDLDEPAAAMTPLADRNSIA